MLGTMNRGYEKKQNKRLNENGSINMQYELVVI